MIFKGNIAELVALLEFIGEEIRLVVLMPRYGDGYPTIYLRNQAEIVLCPGDELLIKWAPNSFAHTLEAKLRIAMDKNKTQTLLFDEKPQNTFSF